MKSAHEQLAEIILQGSDAKPSELETLCQQIREAKELDKPHEPTGATLLALALTLLREDVVASLIKAGVNVNLAIGLKGREKRLPIVIMIGKQHISEPKTLFLDEEKGKAYSIPHDYRHCTCQLKRGKVLSLLLKHPQIDIEKKDESRRTPLDWDADFSKNICHQSVAPQIQHCLRFGSAESMSNYAKPASNSEASLFHNGKSKTAGHTSKVEFFHHRSENPETLWMKKTYDQKFAFLGKNLDVDQTEYSSTEDAYEIGKKKLTSSKAVKDHYLFRVGDRWWAAGEYPLTHHHCTPFDEKFEIPTTPHASVLLINKMQAQFSYNRCSREVVAMEWRRLFKPDQPRYRVVVGKDLDSARVMVEYIKDAKGSNKQSLSELKTAQSQDFKDYTGLAEALIDHVIVNDDDPNNYNWLMKSKSFIPIDGDRSWAQLTSHNPKTNFDSAIPISKLLSEQSLSPAPYFYWNFFDHIIHNRIQSSAPFFDLFSQWAKTPQFKKQLHVAIFRRICMPDDLLKLFVKHYIKNTHELEQIQNQLITRIAAVRAAALKNEEFQKYVLSEDSKSDLQEQIRLLKIFDTPCITLLCGQNEELIIQTIGQEREQLIKKVQSDLGWQWRQADEKNVKVRQEIDELKQSAASHNTYLRDHQGAWLELAEIGNQVPELKEKEEKAPAEKDVAWDLSALKNAFQQAEIKKLPTTKKGIASKPPSETKELKKGIRVRNNNYPKLVKVKQQCVDALERAQSAFPGQVLEDLIKQSVLIIRQYEVAKEKLKDQLQKIMEEEKNLQQLGFAPKSLQSPIGLTQEETDYLNSPDVFVPPSEEKPSNPTPYLKATKAKRELNSSISTKLESRKKLIDENINALSSETKLKIEDHNKRIEDSIFAQNNHQSHMKQTLERFQLVQRAMQMPALELKLCVIPEYKRKIVVGDKLSLLVDELKAIEKIETNVKVSELALKEQDAILLQEMSSCREKWKDRFAQSLDFLIEATKTRLEYYDRGREKHKPSKRIMQTAAFNIGQQIELKKEAKDLKNLEGKAIENKDIKKLSLTSVASKKVIASLAIVEGDSPQRNKSRQLLVMLYFLLLQIKKVWQTENNLTYISNRIPLIQHFYKRLSKHIYGDNGEAQFQVIQSRHWFNNWIRSCFSQNYAEKYDMCGYMRQFPTETNLMEKLAQMPSSEGDELKPINLFPPK